MALRPPGGRDHPMAVAPPRIDVDTGTWRWVKHWCEGRRRDATSALVTATTSTAEVHFHRGVLAACRELVELGEARGVREDRNG